VKVKKKMNIPRVKYVEGVRKIKRGIEEKN
jgi:hypothetical protein